MSRKTPPTCAPFTRLQRAVQAYALSRKRGGTVEQAERAAIAVCPSLTSGEMPDVAQLASCAIRMASALNSGHKARFAAAREEACKLLPDFPSSE